LVQDEFAKGKQFGGRSFKSDYAEKNQNFQACRVQGKRKRTHG
jgi:hypothetical protein